MKIALAYAGRRLAPFLKASVALAAAWIFVLWLRSL